MKDGYSFHTDLADLDAYYPSVYQAYFNIFRRAGLDVIAVESDTGMMGGTMAHEFMTLTPIGEDTLLICDSCHYKANRQIASFVKPTPAAEEAGGLEEVETPGVNTIAALAKFLDVPESRTAKAIFLMAEVDDEEDAKSSRQQFVFVVVRGDMELNETKLTNVLKARKVRPATPDEIRAVGAEPGYGSPIGIDRSQVLLVVDDLIAASPNLVAGADRLNWHYKSVNYGRDYSADIVVDLVAAAEGYACPICGGTLQAVRGVEVGNIFKLGTKYSTAMGATFPTKTAKATPWSWAATASARTG